MSLKGALLALSTTVKTATATNFNTASRVGTLFQSIVNALRENYDVTAYGAVGDGTTPAATESAGFAAAAAAAALVGGTVYVPKGTYGDGTGWSFALPSGVALEGDGDASVLKCCLLTCTGTVGSEIAFTAPAAKGAASISIPATGLDNTWVRLASVINAGSPDAVLDQLGDTPADDSYLAEFALVKTGAAGSATLARRTIFPYSNTPGADTGPGLTTSIARVVTFHESSRIRRLKFLGKNSAENTIITATWCRDLIIDDVKLDSNDATSQNIRMVYCLDCQVLVGRNIGKRTSVPASSTANNLLISSCQDCVVDGTRFEGGYQCVDITYEIDSVYRGGPSIDCGVVNGQASNMELDGFTDHQGCLRSFFSNCTAKGGTNGFRIRSRGSAVRGCRANCIGATGSGVLVMGAALFDCDVSRNRVDGYVYGIEYRSSETGYAALRASLVGAGQAAIEGNTISNTSAEGIIAINSPALATMLGPQIRFNRIYAPGGDGIEIGSYVNGAVIDHNRITGVASGQRGIRWAANIKRLFVGTNYVYNVNAAGFAMGGPSTASFMTDAATFPAGEAEAFLHLGPVHTDAATPLTSILRSTVAYAPPTSAGFGGGTLVEPRALRGAGSPEGVVYAPVGWTYERTDGGAGTSHYFKETGTSNTGWVAK